MEQKNSMKRHPCVGIVVLNWNGASDTIKCLETIFMMDYPDYEVIVVDNGSTDDSVRRIRGYYPDIKIIGTSMNLGFAGGNNVGIRFALEKGTNYVLLLNNDTVVAPDFLTKMVEVAEADKRIGIMSPKIYFYDVPDLIQYAGGKLSLWRGYGYSLLKGKKDSGLKGTVETTFIPGCAMLMRREIIKQIGLLDERYFLVVEDVDYCYRALQRGWKLAVCLDAKIWHKVSRATGRDSALNRYYFTRNRLLFVFDKTGGFWHKVAFVFFFPPSRLVNSLIWALAGKGHRIKPNIQGIVDFLQRRMGKQLES